MSGLIAFTSSYPKPSRSIPASRTLWMNTSAFSSNASSTALSSDFLMLRLIAFLLRLSAAKIGPCCLVGESPAWRIRSPGVLPSEFSILITSAPRSARFTVAKGPSTTVAISTTLMPFKGPVSSPSHFNFGHAAMMFSFILASTTSIFKRAVKRIMEGR